MTKRVRPIIVGNWKMNPATLPRAEKLFLAIQKGLGSRAGPSLVAIAPPAPFLSELQQLSGPQKLAIAAQDVSAYESGAYTGEVSASMLRSLGVKSAIIGHSERRLMGEQDGIVREKVARALEARLSVILCVGERERDRAGDYFNVVEDQLESAFAAVKADDLKYLMVAYEPVWAIGTGVNAAPAEAEEMKLFIRKVLSDTYNRADTSGVPILYGGSVKSANAEELLEKGRADGFLIGGASLEAKEFVSIVKIADQYAKFA